jgi:streptomycin 6-kinase
MFTIPDDFVNNLKALHSPECLAWISRLSTILTACEQRWELSIHSPFTNLAYHYTAPAKRSDGTTVVIKAHSPCGEFIREVEALQHFDGQSTVQLLAYDSDREVLLQEFLEPATPLSMVKNNEAAISIASTVMRQMWRPAPLRHPFPSILDLGIGFSRLRRHYGDTCGPFPHALLGQAEMLFTELGSSMIESVLLHGDLRPDHILAATRHPWLAIDPIGLVGEPAYEVGSLLYHLTSQLFEFSQPDRLLAHCIRQLAEELDLDHTRIYGWALVQAVLVVWWGIEDFGHLWASELAYAEVLSTVKV